MTTAAFMSSSNNSAYMYTQVYMCVHNVHMTAVHACMYTYCTSFQKSKYSIVMTSQALLRFHEACRFWCCISNNVFVDNAAALIDYWANACTCGEHKLHNGMFKNLIRNYGSYLFCLETTKMT